MNNDINTAAHLSIGTNAQRSPKAYWFRWVFYQYLSDDLCSHASYQHCGKMLSIWIKLLYSSEKVRLLY